MGCGNQGKGEIEKVVHMEDIRSPRAEHAKGVEVDDRIHLKEFREQRREHDPR